MHLTAQTLTIIGIPLLGIPAVTFGFWGLYYNVQAGNNLKPDSKWRGWGGSLNGPIPRSEFTELGLRYRRRTFIMSGVLLAWFLVIVVYFVPMRLH